MIGVGCQHNTTDVLMISYMWDQDVIYNVFISYTYHGPTCRHTDMIVLTCPTPIMDLYSTQA